MRVVYFILAMASLHGTARAFDYLEHSYFTDQSCREAMTLIENRLRQVPADVTLQARYIALGLLCGQRAEKYCDKGRKQWTGFINEAFITNGDHPLTMGDYSAMVDHTSNFGSLRGIEHLRKRGMITTTLLALKPGTEVIDDQVEDIAEEACETEKKPDYRLIEEQVAGYLNRSRQLKHPPSLKPQMLSQRRRVAVTPGPQDNATLFTIENPHFLDMQLYNHNHFGRKAYRAWLGYHDAAIAVGFEKCEDVLRLSRGDIEDLAEDINGFNEIDFDDLEKTEFRKKSCSLVKELVRRRILQWQNVRNSSFTPGSVSALKQVSSANDLLLDKVTVNLISLVLEGAGLHHLQDSMSGGHVRTDRNARGLWETRMNHDFDSKYGVVARFSSHKNQLDFIAYGDTYLLGSTRADTMSPCESASSTMENHSVTACHLANQRGLLVASNSASILDWALGGVMYRPSTTFESGRPSCNGQIEEHICQFLPTGPVVPAGMADNVSKDFLQHETLPVPHPPIDYESLKIITAYDPGANVSQLGASVSLLSGLGSSGHWMQSYNFAFLTTLGGTNQQQFLHEFSYKIHFRFATRFLFHLGALTYFGFEGLDNRFNLFYGLGPNAGITLLPEGWTKIPLEISLSYRAPWRFVETDKRFYGQKLDAHWIEFAIGLAFL